MPNFWIALTILFIDLDRFKQEFESLPISDKTKERVLSLNAREFLDL